MPIIISYNFFYHGSEKAIKLKPSDIPLNYAHCFISFGVYAQSYTPNSISAAMKYESGSTISSSSHTGSGNWEFIGMSALFDNSCDHHAFFSITGDVNVTAPTFIYGKRQVSPGSEFISSSKGRMSGVRSLQSLDVAPQSGSQWVLPRDGKVFFIHQFDTLEGSNCATTYNNVYFFNDKTVDRFPKGSIIIIFFPSCGACVPCLGMKDNAYISLLVGNDFVPDPSLSDWCQLDLDKQRLRYLARGFP